MPIPSAPALAGKRAFVTASGGAIGARLARGLAQQGAKVALLTDAVPDAAGNQIESVLTGFGARIQVEQAFASAAQKIGQADLMVHCALPAASLIGASIESLDLDQWQSSCDAAMKATLYVLQAAHAHFAGRGGAIILVGPTLGLVGAAGYVPLTTAIEGQRSLMKAAARQWGRQGISLNWISIASGLVSSTLGDAEPKVPELGPPPPALGAAPDIETGIASAIAYLASDAGRATASGLTLNLDGGNWMVP